MIPEEDAAEVEAEVRALIEQTVSQCPGIRLDIKRLLLAHSMQPLPGAAPLVAALQKHASEVFGEPIPTSGTPSTPMCGSTRRGAYGGGDLWRGPRTVLESNAKRADEHLVLADLQHAHPGDRTHAG